MSPPVGPTGCEGSDAGQGQSAWLAGASASAFATTLKFGNESVAVSEQIATASVGRRFGDRFTLRLSGGAVVGGRATGASAYVIDPGWLASATVARRWLGGGNNAPFFATALTLGVASAATTDASGSRAALVAQDTRIAGVLGGTFGRIWSPYLLASVFGGPVAWDHGTKDRVGSDRYHYSVGLGGSLALAKAVDLFAEAAFFGEQSAALGMSFSFWDG
jgi:hypothetical protein